VPPRDWRIRFEDILDAIVRIQSYTEGLTVDVFLTDQKTQDAVIRNLEIIGECARLVDDETAARAADVPWQDVCDMRNVLVHEYFGVDLDIVWATVQTDLQPLAESLRRALNSSA
jgi:uncharacterized protein with HEPN domain